MTTKKWNVAVLGATGLVGDMLLRVLEERDFPVAELFPLASSRSVGKRVEFAGKQWPVIDAETFDFSRAQIGLFSAGGDVSARYAPRAAAAGCVVVDNTSQFRYEADIPLVVPEVNAAAIAQYKSRGIIANPNCSTIQMLVALKPIYDAAGIERINVATYQSVSGAGKKATDRTHYMFVAENLAPYKTLRAHQHLVEVERAVSVRLLFVPLVAPLRRGMLISGTVPLRAGVTQADLDAMPPLDAFWRRVTTAPDVQQVANTPWIAVHYALDPQSQRLQFVTALDNLSRGAATQAIANLNLMWQWPETTGLI